VGFNLGELKHEEVRTQKLARIWRLTCRPVRSFRRQRHLEHTNLDQLRKLAEQVGDEGNTPLVDDVVKDAQAEDEIELSRRQCNDEVLDAGLHELKLKRGRLPRQFLAKPDVLRCVVDTYDLRSQGRERARKEPLSATQVEYLQRPLESVLHGVVDLHEMCQSIDTSPRDLPAQLVVSVDGLINLGQSGHRRAEG